MPRGSTPLHDRRPQRIEYDDGMRNEEHTYSPLMTEVENAGWLIGHVPIDDIPLCGIRACGGVVLTIPQPGEPLSAVIHSDVGNPLHSKRDIHLTMDGAFFSDSEATGLTDEELHHDCFLTMEQVLQREKKVLDSDVGKHRETNGTQNVISFYNSRSAPEMDTSLSFKCRVNSSVFDDLSGSGGRAWQCVYGFWFGEVRRLHDDWQIPRFTQSWTNWDHTKVELIKTVLQQWRGICSFSQSEGSTGSRDDDNTVVDLSF